MMDHATPETVVNATTTATFAWQIERLALAITADEPPGDVATLLRRSPDGAPARIEIYRHAFRARLSDALRDNFPVLHRVLGDASFDQLAREFIAARPSRHRSIRWFGSELADHLALHRDALAHPSLPDLARMEWALGLAFDAADENVIGVDDLLDLPEEAWPELRLRFHPSLSLLALDWAVEPAWRALSDDPEAEVPVPEAHAHHMLAWRRDDQTQWRSVSPVEAALLEAAQTGLTFAELCELATRHDPTQPAATAAGLLRVWVEAGLVAAKN